MIKTIFIDWLIGSVISLIILVMATLAFYAAYFLLNLGLTLGIILAIPVFILTGWCTIIGFFLALLALFTLIGEA